MSINEFVSKGGYCNNYPVDGDYLFRIKTETNKEKLMRQRSAFKGFYKKAEFKIVKSKNDFNAEQKETFDRENKFKSLHRNLIIVIKP